MLQRMSALRGMKRKQVNMASEQRMQTEEQGIRTAVLSICVSAEKTGPGGSQRACDGSAR